MTVKHTILVNRTVKEIFWLCKIHIHLCRSSQITFICSCCSNGPCIHQCYGCYLSALYFRTFTIREVPCRMTNGKTVICRRISGAKTRSAKRCLHHSSCSHDLSRSPVAYQLHIDRHTGRVYTQRKFICSDTCAIQNIRRITNIFKSASCASCNNTLIYIQSAITYFFFQIQIHRTIKTNLRLLLTISKNVHQVMIQFFDCICITRMERHCYHRFYRT